MLTDPYSDEVGPYGDSETSKLAAIDNFPRSGSQRRRVLHSLVASGERGKTRDEISQELGLRDSSVDARVWELEKGGWIEESDAVRETSSGSKAVVMVLTSDAVTALLDPQNSHLLK